MDPNLLCAISMVIFVLVLILGMPVAYAMFIIGFAGIGIMRSPAVAFDLTIQELYTTFSMYSMAVAPMFILMGTIALYSGIGADVYNSCYKFLGRYRGGLALATQAACALFGAVCGSLTATVATMGYIALPEMKKYNYDDRLSTGSIIAGASLGSLIPPSMILIIYGIATENSIGKLFLAGVTSGIVHMLVYMFMIAVLVKMYPSMAPAGSGSVSLREKIASLRGGVVDIVIVFLISIGGLFLGWFTPTESGAVGAFAIMAVTFIRKKMNWEKLNQALTNTVSLSAMIFLLVAGAKLFSRYFVLTRIPFELSNWVGSLPLPGWTILLVISIIWFFLGCFIDAMALILLTAPIFVPIISSLGYDPIWFGIVMVVFTSTAVVTPPIGMNVFVMKGVAPEVPIETIFRGAIPFIIADFIFIALLIAFPGIATFLPQLLY